MPRLNKTQQALVKSLVRKHASNAIVRRQVNRGIKKATPYINRGLNQLAVRAGEYFTGSGDYHVGNMGKVKHVGNSIMHGNVKRQHAGYLRPKIQSRKNDMETMIIHSEFIGNLVSSSTTNSFIAQNYGINAGNIGFASWLAGVSANYEEYSFDSLIVEYKPLVSSATSTTSGTLVSMGKVVLAVDYNSVNGGFTSSATAENSFASVSVNPSEPCFLAVECKNNMNPMNKYYVSNQQNLTAGQNNSDIRFQNMGVLSVIADQIPIASSTAITLGQIFLHYRVRLTKPVLVAGLSNLLTAHYKINSGSQAYPLGVSSPPTASSTNFLPLTFNASTNVNSFYFPLSVTQGSFLVCYTGYTSSTTFVGAAFTSPNNTVTFTQLFNVDNNSYYPFPLQAGAASASICILCVASVNAPGSVLGQIQVNVTTMGTNITAGDLIITPFNTTVIT